jgi:hypothetical protein
VTPCSPVLLSSVRRRIVSQKSTPSIPEAIVQLKRQLDQFRNTQPQRTKPPEPLWQAPVELARQRGIYPVAHPLRLDYMGLKRRARRSSNPPTQANQADIRRTDRATGGAVGRVCHRFGMPQWAQNAHADAVEGFGATRLGKFAARLAGNGRMIHIATQMRILVAVEAIDGRKGINGNRRKCSALSLFGRVSTCVMPPTYRTEELRERRPDCRCCQSNEARKGNSVSSQ